MAGMALSALLGVTAMLAFVTVGWPGNWGSVVIGVFIACIIGFMTCASLAVFSAARDTYPRRNSKEA